MTDKYYKKLFIVTLVFLSELVVAQNYEFNLWNSEVPGAIEAKDYKEVYNLNLDRVSKVKTPTLTIFVPDKPNGTSVIICPGGGYAFLAINKEGYTVAKWLNTLGITAYVLKYRLPSDVIMIDKSIGPLQDAQEAIRYLRRNAKKWNLNKNKIGIMGFSAGGHLAATLSTNYNYKTYTTLDNISARPSFSILIYPVISMEEKITHKGSRARLLGGKSTAKLIKKFSNEQQVNPKTPPTFLIHATDDLSVPVENSIAYYLSLKKNHVLSELHLYQNGNHGFGLGKKETSKNWTKQCTEWLVLNKFIN